VYLCRFDVLFSFILSKLGQSSYGYDGDLAVKQRTRTTKAGEREKERDLQTSTSSGRSEIKERQDRKGKKGLATGNLQVLERSAHPSAASPSLFLRPASVFSLFTDVVVIGEGRMPHPPLHLKLKKKGRRIRAKQISGMPPAPPLETGGKKKSCTWKKILYKHTNTHTTLRIILHLPFNVYATPSGAAVSRC
jgi:hypothetical protein